MLFKAALAALLGVVLVLAGCGASHELSSNMPTPAPTPVSPTPGPTPNPTPTPSPSPTPTGESPDNYFATQILENGDMRTDTGQLTVDVSANDGSGNARGKVAASSNQKLQFCPTSATIRIASMSRVSPPMHKASSM